MKKSIFIFIIGSFLLCCDHKNEPDEPEQPEEPKQPYCSDPYEPYFTCDPDPYEIPCGCPDEWPQEEIIYDRELPWDYPIKPGTDEWKELLLGERGVFEAALQIPEEILASLTTEDLMALIILNPYIVSFFLISGNGSYEIGLDYGFSSFNGIRELFQREDGLEVLLKHYRYMTQNWSSLYGVVSFPITTVHTLELILSRYQSPDESNKENYLKIVEYLLCGLEEQIMYFSNTNEEVHITNYRSNFYSRAIILIKIDEQNLENIPDGMNNRLFLKDNLLFPSIVKSISNLTCKCLYNNQ